ncbi:hypothetical protein ABZP36_010412 [Zizania latifolia]
MEKGKEVLESSSQNKRPRMTRGADKGGSQGALADSARGKGKEVLSQSTNQPVMECSQGRVAKSARVKKTARKKKIPARLLL